jgi:protein-S-isoprenylcysteine O-methyltransferase Ste14
VPTGCWLALHAASGSVAGRSTRSLEGIKMSRAQFQRATRVFRIAAVVVVAGVSLGFLAYWLSVRWLGLVAYAIVGVAWLVAVIYTLWAFVNFPGAIIDDFGATGRTSKDPSSNDKG